MLDATVVKKVVPSLLHLTALTSFLFLLTVLTVVHEGVLLDQHHKTRCRS